jgi:hypothetical protein
VATLKRGNDPPRETEKNTASLLPLAMHCELLFPLAAAVEREIENLTNNDLPNQTNKSK